MHLRSGENSSRSFRDELIFRDLLCCIGRVVSRGYLGFSLQQPIKLFGNEDSLKSLGYELKRLESWIFRIYIDV